MTKERWAPFTASAQKWFRPNQIFEPKILNFGLYLGFIECLQNLTVFNRGYSRRNANRSTVVMTTLGKTRSFLHLAFARAKSERKRTVDENPIIVHAICPRKIGW